MLYTMVLTVDLENDTEARLEHEQLVRHVQGGAEVVEARWFRDLDAEVLAALAGVEWGGR